MERQRSRLALGLTALWCVALLAVVASRPYDQALFQSAGVSGDWVEHREAVRAALRLRDGFAGWWAETDLRYPPLLHLWTWSAGALVGYDAAALLRLQLLFSLALAASAAGIAGALSGRRAALAAGAVCLGLPACTASALVLHYDLLPFALLWLAMATAVALQDRRPLAGGGAVGLLLAGACVAKWSAPFFFLPLMIGAVLCGGPGTTRVHPGRRLAFWGVAAAVGLGLVDRALRISMRSFSELLELSYGAPAQGAGLADAARSALSALGSVHAEERPPMETWEPFFLPFRFAVGTATPVLLLLLVLGIAAWAWRSRRGAGLVAVGTPALWAVLVFVIDKTDDRWLVALVPAYAVAAGLGWAALGPRTRAALAGGWFGVSLWVAWDFHHARRDHPHTQAIAEELRLPDHWSWAGMGADSTVDTTYGWSRLDAGGLEPFLPHKDDAWAAAMACGPVALRVEDPGLQPVPDDVWWDYRNHLHALRTGADLLDVTTLDGQRYSGQTRTGRTVALVVADREQRPPIEELLPGYTLVTTIPAPDGPYTPIAVYADGPCP